jgi:hypothetical protein
MYSPRGPSNYTAEFVAEVPGNTTVWFDPARPATELQCYFVSAVTSFAEGRQSPRNCDCPRYVPPLVTQLPMGFGAPQEIGLDSVCVALP